ncbi:hypothetical protein L1987_54513 [Smallanthus sonchifolius]|uniref:Uncharacterized protein n=1 Tax=Smallanthus sonchifolius TaxID=185202 RepID=A0ACB9E6Z6_9ASTR|nr:hypothetical protein L1987_54513 [Smallanthus sonchifolius]
MQAKLRCRVSLQKRIPVVFFVVLLHQSPSSEFFNLSAHNALTDPQLVRTPDVIEYWEPLAKDMDVTAGIEAQYHHKNN